MTCWWSFANGKRVESLAPMTPHSPQMQALEPRLLLDGALVECPDGPGGEPPPAAVPTQAAQTPGLEAGVRIDNQNGSPLITNYMSAPTVLDWNNDGKKDLVVGQFTQGYIWLFLNQGTDSAPAFSGGTLIYSGAAPITTSYG